MRELKLDKRGFPWIELEGARKASNMEPSAFQPPALPAILSLDFRCWAQIVTFESVVLCLAPPPPRGISSKVSIVFLLGEAMFILCIQCEWQVLSWVLWMERWIRRSWPWDFSDCRGRRQTFLTVINLYPRSYRREKYKGIWKHKGESEIREDFLRRKHLRRALKTK